MSRQLPDWLDGLRTYVEETEAPRVFWLWSGIFTLCAALQRRVWIPHGLENIYPNIYVLIVAPPASRKGLPASIAKQFLQEIEVAVSKDSSSKRDLTKELARISQNHTFYWESLAYPQTPMAIISKEMSSLLAVDPKGMIEVLTDLFDSPDKWHYGTSGQGDDKLFGVCISCFVLTTPTWLIGNLPNEAVGGGYTSRHIIVTDDKVYKRVPIPPLPDPILYKSLVHDLLEIKNLKGPFEWDPKTYAYYHSWYSTSIDSYLKQISDERLHGFIGRLHLFVLKTAMAFVVSKTNKLMITMKDLLQAIQVIEEVLFTASDALGSRGESRTSYSVQKILRQIRHSKTTSFKELLRLNHRDTNRTELNEVLDTLSGMGNISMLHKGENNIEITYVDQPKGRGRRKK